jgi:CheY-like chemotaxis protein
MIMIVDDVISNRKLIKENFLTHKFTVIEAEDGKQAVDLATEHKPGIVFMDIRMPVMDGFEASRIIKTNPETQHIKIIALTASVRNEAQEADYTAFFDGYLHKPVTRSELFKELMKFINYRQTSTGFDNRKQNMCSIQSGDELKVSQDRAGELLQAIDLNLMKKWDKAYRFQLSDEMKKFAETVVEVGVEFNFKPFEEFGNQFLQALDSFELDTMENCLKNFPKMIEQIKKQLINQ